MDVTPFIMVLLGCVDGSPKCEPIMTLPAAYSDEASCKAARGEILEAVGDKRVIAECRPKPISARNAAKVSA